MPRGDETRVDSPLAGISPAPQLTSAYTILGMDHEQSAKYALAAVDSSGVNKGETLVIDVSPDDLEAALAIAEQAYAKGAGRVQIFTDPNLAEEARSAIEEARAKVVPANSQEHWDDVSKSKPAFVAVNGGSMSSAKTPNEQDEFARAKKAFNGARKDGDTRWTIAITPSKQLAAAAYPGDSNGVERVAQDLASFARCGPDDDPDAPQRHIAKLHARAAAINEMGFDSIRIKHESGTDLTVGLLDTSMFTPVSWATSEGKGFVCNMPTEEIFCTPDPSRASGHVEMTRPLIISGQVVHHLYAEFEDGELVIDSLRCDPPYLEQWLKDALPNCPGALNLGELALVGNDSRVSKTGHVYQNTIIDENAGTHVALGNGYREGLSDRDDDRRNESNLHVDLTVGGDTSTIIGVYPDGSEVPVMIEGEWQV